MSVRHRAAVIGQPVAHSLSPVLHRAAYEDLGLEDWEYLSREVAPGELEELLARLGAPAGEAPTWEGLSVTMPHKQRLLTLVDIVDPLAQTVGAANTVVAQRSGTGPALLAAFNTDVAGIVGALRETAGPAAAGGGTAFVLGSGATACSALAALTELGARRIVVAARHHAGPGRALAAAHRMGLEIEALTWRPQEEASCREVPRPSPVRSWRCPPCRLARRTRSCLRCAGSLDRARRWSRPRCSTSSMTRGRLPWLLPGRRPGEWWLRAGSCCSTRPCRRCDS